MSIKLYITFAEGVDNGAVANTVTTHTVSAQAVPWRPEVGTNAAYTWSGYGPGTTSVDPVVVATGLSTGQIVIVSAAGLVTSNFRDAPYIDADGAVFDFSGTTNKWSAMEATFPGSFIVGSPTTVNLGQDVLGWMALIGAFTDGSGNVIQPVWVGALGRLTVPAGATQLQLGTNDTSQGASLWSDNVGSFAVTVATYTSAAKAPPVQYTREYTRYINYNSLQIVDQLNVPTMCTFELTNLDNLFVPPPRGAYVKVYSSKYDLYPFTGFITSPPEIAFMGVRTPGGYLPRVYTYRIKCTSDEYLLNNKVVPFVPAFLNQTQGQILAGIANALAPGYFDLTSHVASGDLVPYYQYDPSETFSSVAKKFADDSFYRYKCIDKKLYFLPYNQTPFPVRYDTTAGEATFDARKFDLRVLDNPVVNDVITLGAAEAGAYGQALFIGDGFTSNFPLSDEMFRGETQLLFQEDWTGTDFNSQSWNVYPTGSTHFQLFQGSLNIIGGDGLGQSYIQGVNSIELGGNLYLQHGQFIFTNQSDGIIGGLYFSSPALTGGLLLPDCFCGFSIGASGASGTIIEPILNGQVLSSPSNPGAASIVVGIALGASGTNYNVNDVLTLQGGNFNCLVTVTSVSQSTGQVTGLGLTEPGSGYALATYPTEGGMGSGCTVIVTALGPPPNFPVVVNPRHQYVLITYISGGQQFRYNRAYRSLAGPHYGSDLIPSGGVITFAVYDIDPFSFVTPDPWTYIPQNQIPILTQVLTSYTTSINTMPGVCLYVPFNSVNLNLSANTLMIAQPPQALLLTYSSPASAQIFSGPTQHGLGFGLLPSLQHNVASIVQGQSQSTSQLSFYNDTIPAAQKVIVLKYRVSQQSVSRVVDEGSVFNTALLAGDDGRRGSIQSNLSPKPRSSEECDAAGAAFIADAVDVLYQGSYTASFLFTSYGASGYPVPGCNMKVRDPDRIDSLRTPPNLGITLAGFNPTTDVAIYGTAYSVIQGTATTGPIGTASARGDGGVLTFFGANYPTMYLTMPQIFWSFTAPAGYDSVTWLSVCALVSNVAGTFGYSEIWCSTNGGGSWSNTWTAHADTPMQLTSLAIPPGTPLTDVRLKADINETFEAANVPPTVLTVHAVYAIGRTSAGNLVVRMGSAPTVDFLVRKVTSQYIELQQEIVDHTIEFGQDTYLQRTLNQYVAFPNVLRPVDTAVQPLSQALATLGTAFLEDLDSVSLNGITCTGAIVDFGLNPGASGYVVEVRSSDLGWGTTTVHNLVGVFNTRGATLQRTQDAQRFYMRLVDPTGLTSRRTSIISLHAPMPPPSIAGHLNMTKYDDPLLEVSPPLNLQDFFGMEIRTQAVADADVQDYVGAPGTIVDVAVPGASGVAWSGQSVTLGGFSSFSVSAGPTIEAQSAFVNTTQLTGATPWGSTKYIVMNGGVTGVRFDQVGLPAGGQSEFLVLTGFHLNLPHNTKVKGLQIHTAREQMVDGIGVQSAAYTVGVQLVGVLGSASLHDTYGVPWPYLSENTVSYPSSGASTYQWSCLGNATADILNSPSFGFAFSVDCTGGPGVGAECGVDYGWMTIWYDAPVIQSSDYLEFTNCGLSVPTNQLVLGVQVTVSGTQTATPPGAFIAAQLIKNGQLYGTIKTGALHSVSGAIVFGGELDEWGATTLWTAADVNASNFGISLRAYNEAGDFVTWNVTGVKVEVFAGIASPVVMLRRDYLADSDLLFHLNTSPIFKVLRNPVLYLYAYNLINCYSTPTSITTDGILGLGGGPLTPPVVSTVNFDPTTMLLSWDSSFPTGVQPTDIYHDIQVDSTGSASFTTLVLDVVEHQATHVVLSNVVASQIFDARVRGVDNAGPGDWVLYHWPGGAPDGGFLAGGGTTTVGGGGVHIVLLNSYALQASDNAKLIILQNDSNPTLTLPAGLSSSYFANVLAPGVSGATLVPALGTIDGQGSLFLATDQGVELFCDGTNWWTSGEPNLIEINGV